MKNLLPSPRPWEVGGPLAGLIVPLPPLDNRISGISATRKPACAVLLPGVSRPGFFRHDWRI